MIGAQATGAADLPDRTFQSRRHSGSGAPSQQVTVFCLQPGHSQRLAIGSYRVPQCRHSSPADSRTGVRTGAGGAPLAVVSSICRTVRAVKTA